MRFLSQRLLFIILSLVFVIAAFFVYSNFVKPEYDTVSQLRSELALKTDTLSRYETSFLKLQNMLGGQNIGQLKDSVSRILPNEVNNGYLMAQIVGFAKLNNLSIVSVSNSFEPIVASKSRIIKSVGVLKTKVVVNGTYGGVKTYVQQLENNLLLMDVVGFGAEPKKEKSEAGYLEYSITITSYYQTK